MTYKKNSDWVARLVASRIFCDADAWAIVEPVRCALQRLIDGEGGGSRTDVGAVGFALNLAWYRSRKQLDEGSMRALEASGLALAECERRGDPAGAYILTLEEKEQLCAGVNLYEIILRECSLMQWAEAESDFIAQLAEASTAA